MKRWKKANPSLIKPLKQRLSLFQRIKMCFEGKRTEFVIYDEMHEHKMGGMSYVHSNEN